MFSFQISVIVLWESWRCVTACFFCFLHYSFSWQFYVFHFKSRKNSRKLPWGISHCHFHALCSYHHSHPAILSTWWKNLTTRWRKIFIGSFFKWLSAEGWKGLKCILLWGSGGMHEVVVQWDRGRGLNCVCTDYFV